MKYYFWKILVIMNSYLQKKRSKAKLFMGHIEKKSLIKLAVWVMALVLFSLLIAQYIGEETMKAWVEKAWIWWPLVIIGFKSLTVFVAPLSWTAIYIIWWWLFGFFRWNIYNIIGNGLGISLAFFLWRKRWAQATNWLLWKEATDMILDLSNKLVDYKNLVITRIIFFPLEDLINFAWGMSKIRFLPFLVISLLITSIVWTARVYLGDVLF